MPTACDHSTAAVGGRCVFTPRTHAVSGRIDFGVEVDHLRDRVHAGIGPARGRDADRMAGDLPDRGFERVLHAAARRLRLEAAERGARVLDA